jgi:hypothetical protein
MVNVSVSTDMGSLLDEPQGGYGASGRRT